MTLREVLRSSTEHFIQESVTSAADGAGRHSQQQPVTGASVTAGSTGHPMHQYRLGADLWRGTWVSWWTTG